MASSFDPLEPTFFLFATDLSLARRAERAGIDHVIIDWERLGKADRQEGFETEINSDSPEDVVRLSEALDMNVTVRINQMHEETEREIEVALSCGADAIMFPMARRPDEVQTFVNMVGDRASTFVQIETHSLAQQAGALRTIDWDYAHIGLNDLKITGDHDWLWQPLHDGTIRHICTQLHDRCIGFGSATIVGGGAPIPFINLMQEMARLGCTVKILRRTFKKEIGDRNMRAELNAYRTVWNTLCRRGETAEAEDHQRLSNTLQRCRQRALATA
jgi:hypothetical protein